MLTKQILSFGMLNRLSLVKPPSLYSDNKTIQRSIQTKQFTQYIPLLNYTSRTQISIVSCYSFTTSKKIIKNPQKKIFKLKKSQLKPDLNAFLLYDGQKQQKSFFILSGLFILLFGLSLVKLYYTESEYRRDQYIILFVVAGSFIIYQKRILKTLKKITLNTKGDKLSITTFNLLGKGQKTVQAPVEIMTGIFRATRFGGYILKGGGKSSFYKEMKFWFSKQYISDQNTFEYVAQGKLPKIVDEYQSL